MEDGNTMIYMILGIVLGLFFFISTIAAYTLGLKHGKQLGNREMPTINLNPVKAYTKHVEAKAEKTQQDLIDEGFKNIMSYTGEIQE